MAGEQLVSFKTIDQLDAMGDYRVDTSELRANFTAGRRTTSRGSSFTISTCHTSSDDQDAWDTIGNDTMGLTFEASPAGLRLSARPLISSRLGNYLNEYGVLIPLMLTLMVVYFIDVFVLQTLLVENKLIERIEVEEGMNSMVPPGNYQYDNPTKPFGRAVGGTVTLVLFLWCAGHYMTADVIFRTLVCFDFYFIVFIFCLRRVVVVVTECAILRTVFGVDIDGYLVAAHVLNLCNSFAFSLFWSNLDALSPRLNLCTKIIITGVLIIYFVVDLVMYQIKMAPFDEVDCGPGVIGERGGGKKFHCRKMKTLFATTTTTITMLIVQSSKAYIMGYPFAFLRPTYKRQTPLSSGTAGEPMTQESIRPSPQHIKVVPPAESALTVTWWDATVMASPGGTCAPLADDAAKMGEAEEAEEAADALQTAQRRVLELERALQEAKQQHAELAVSIGNSSPAAGDAQEDLSGACSEAAASSAAASSCSLFVPAASASGSGSVVGSGNLSVPPPLEPRSPQRHTTSPS